MNTAVTHLDDYDTEQRFRGHRRLQREDHAGGVRR